MLKSGEQLDTAAPQEGRRGIVQVDKGLWDGWGL